MAKEQEKDAVFPRRKCPLCGGPMVERAGRNGEFLSCAKFPDCKGTRSIQAGDGRSIDAEKQAEAMAFLDKALAFIRECGSVRQAYHWLRVGAAVIDGMEPRRRRPNVRTGGR